MNSFDGHNEYQYLAVSGHENGLLTDLHRTPCVTAGYLVSGHMHHFNSKDFTIAIMLV